MMPVAIPLVNGGSVLVDAADYPLLSQRSWYGWAPKINGVYYTRYARTVEKVPGAPTLMHRILLDAKKGRRIDHVDGDGLNNQRANLRPVTHGQNMMNRRRFSAKSGFKGVYLDKRKNCWRADIKADKKRYRLGGFSTAEAAAAAYDEAAIRLHGEFACTNAQILSARPQPGLTRALELQSNSLPGGPI